MSKPILTRIRLRRSSRLPEDGIVLDVGFTRHGQEELPDIHCYHSNGNEGLLDLHADGQFVDPDDVV